MEIGRVNGRTGRIVRREGNGNGPRAATIRNVRTPKCNGCRRLLNSMDDPKCRVCGWLLCRCGACGCGYRRRILDG